MAFALELVRDHLVLVELGLQHPDLLIELSELDLLPFLIAGIEVRLQLVSKHAYPFVTISDLGFQFPNLSLRPLRGRELRVRRGLSAGRFVGSLTYSGLTCCLLGGHLAAADYIT